ncbi:hypothetical protein CLIB1423_01S11540 [[Candida] railenensis]|uniref:Uncharacterized protein n=1 Tax=[Candida] railenensis TaxID=45579 RepID=A0A9P0VW44_9ASCO|nr:hypothetical protein CLIB1423_01S11540 [[Candida] railenensis]
MVGSSRSLIRSLDTVFSSWKDSTEISSNKQEDSPEVVELLNVITIFHEKHNTLQSIKQSANLINELFRIYDEYVKPTPNLGKEIFFLEILTQLWPFFIEDDALLWLDTYLKPAVDSAGFDLQFVYKSRSFIKRMTTDVMKTDDPFLAARREKIGLQVIDKIVKVYLGGAADRRKIININEREADVNSQEFSEKLRYIKMNCTNIIIEYGLKNTKSLISILNAYLLQSKDRLGALSLLSNLVADESSQTYEIINTNLFGSLLKSLAYDNSENVVAITLSIICMIIPQACDKTGKYLSDLLAIYLRITEWQNNLEKERKLSLKETDHEKKEKCEKDEIKEEEFKSVDWDICNLDPNTTLTRTSQINFKIEFDSKCLITLIYGLFPFNLTKFAQDPKRYLTKYPPRLIKLTGIPSLSDEKIGPKDEEIRNKTKFTSNKIKYFLKGFMLHPNFLDFERASLQQELNSPIKWLLEDREGDDLRVEEIALACLGLNPELIISIPDSLMDQPRLSNNGKSYSIGRIASNANYSSRSDLQQLQNSYESRPSSIRGPIYINPKDGGADTSQFQQYLFNMTRKASLVPSTLVDNSYNHATPGRNHSYTRNFSNSNDIRFKEVIFNEEDSEKAGEINHSKLSEEKSAHSIPPDSDELVSNEALNELFSTHEKLYIASPKYSSVGSTTVATTTAVTNANASKRSSYTLQSPTVSNFDKSTDIYPFNSQQSQQSQDGTAIDFYSRELLLMKNELDFSNYLQQLNKFKYAQLKLKMNRLLREADLHFQSAENKNNLLKIKNLQETCVSFSETIQQLQKEFEAASAKNRSEIIDLLSKQKIIHEENNDLKIKCSAVNSQLQDYKTNLEELVQKIIPEKDIEIERLRKKSQIDLIDNHTLPSTPSTLPSPGSSREISTPVVDGYFDKSPSLELSEQEKKIHGLRTEVLMANEKNAQLNAEIIKLQDLFDINSKSYEQKIASLKHEINSNASSYLGQYERKIQDLSAAILKYEGLIETKNTKILQLSTSRPISIPLAAAAAAAESQVRTSIPIHHQQQSNQQISHHFNSRLPSTGTSANYDIDTNTRSNSSVDTMPSSPHPNSGIMTPHSMSQQQQQQQQHQFQYPTVAQGPPPRTNSSTSANLQPIVKGRGGYQKRAKKLM